MLFNLKIIWKKSQQDKIDLENRSKIIDNVYGHNYIAHDMHEMDFMILLHQILKSNKSLLKEEGTY